MKTTFLNAMTVAVIVMAAGVWAQGPWDCGTNNVTATLNGGTLTISGSGAMVDYTFSSSPNTPWNGFSELITDVVIEGGVTSIGVNAFYGCTNLTSVTIPNSVTSIGGAAFFSCTGLTSVTIPNSVISIEQMAFQNCTGLTSVTIPNSVTSIGMQAFSNTGLTFVAIGSGLISVGDNAFGCTSLTSIDVSTSNTVYSSLDDVLFNKAKDTLLLYPKSKQGAYNIPNGVISFGDAFADCIGLTSVTIPNSVTSIDQNAFYDCGGLTSVTIGNGVTSIGESAFYNCTGLTAITIGNSVTSIGRNAFGGCCNLAAMTIPVNATLSYPISEYCVSNVSSVTINGTGDMVDYPGGAPWEKSNRSITTVVIEDGVTSIGQNAFIGCIGLRSITIPNSVTSIGNNAFDGAGLTSITIPNSVTSIGTGAFARCNGLTSVTIPNSVTSIGWSMFRDCRRLTSVTIGSGVTSIGGDAFAGCSGLTSVTSLAVVPPNTNKTNLAFRDVSSSACLLVPETSIEAYRSAYDWENFTCIKSLDGIDAVLTSDRVVPQPKPNEEATVIAPVVILAGEFTAGPNPVARQSGSVNFYRQGKRVSNSELRIYDAMGNIINKVKISDNVIGNQSRRKVGTWDLCDRNGRIVLGGTYLVEGVVKTSDGKSEKVSVILGVR